MYLMSYVSLPPCDHEARLNTAVEQHRFVFFSQCFPGLAYGNCSPPGGMKHDVNFTDYDANKRHATT